MHLCWMEKITWDSKLRRPDEAEPKTLHESSVVRNAAQLLSDGNYHSLPVVENDKNLIGIVTSTDLINYL